ncbi:MAG: hypothetical protein K2H78_00455 [Clostridia bacterium]|nr:hypothetical protein [Clostridia bacterium]
MILTNRVRDITEIGGKAYNLLSLGIKNTPPLFVCPASYFERAEKDGSLKAQLEKDIQNLLSDKKLYAVRSSAVDEDSASDSFAGVHDSYLNVRKKDVLSYIEKVRDSAFTERAVAYRKTKGLRAERENIAIAVVIQEMVEADFAGVINTINPVTDNPDEIVISVTRGLGDKIVDGTESGSTYTVFGGSVKVDGEDILSGKLLRGIVGLAKEVARKTNTFQDIEFACRRGKVYFLQARAITTYGDINPHKRNLLIDNSNIIESFFGVTSPLTFSFANDVYRQVYCAALKCGKVRKKIYDAVSPSLADMLYYFEGKIYYNMNSWYHGLSIFPMKNTASYFENMIGAHSGTGEYRRVKMNGADVIRFAATFISKLRNIDKLVDSFEEKFERTVMPYYGKKLTGTNAQLLALADKIERDITGDFVIPIINDCAVMYYFGRLRERAEKLGISPEELNKYISNGGDVKSADSATKLVELVEAIKSDSAIYNDFATLDEGALAEKYRSGTPVSSKLDEYIRLFGARVIDELKLETVTMIEDEKLLYRLVKDNLALTYKPPVYEQPAVPKKLKRLVEKTKKYMRLRERLRLKRTYVYSVVRNIFLALGENYCKEGRLESARDVFYLTKKEALSGEGDFARLVEKRKAEEREYLTKPTFDRIAFFDGKPLFVKANRKKGGLQGIPSGNGTVTARVSLMQSPQDKLVAGNIILTKRTDPGWISLFPLAGGLIVEYGSMLSHSFVVARELNLPAVVGLKNATELIPDGATVFLDGLHGEVKILDE